LNYNTESILDPKNALLVDEPKEKPKSSKRTNYLAWDEYFMAMALLTAERSKDPVTQVCLYKLVYRNENFKVGAVIVDKQNVIAGVGYNGMPRGCHDDKMPWSKDMENPLENKYLFVVHAEINAILNRSILRDECTMYVTLFPCSECAKAVIQVS
jgi:dCMP deaminase